MGGVKTMELLGILWSFSSFLNFEFLKAIFELITKGVIFAQSNYYHEIGEVQKEKCIDFINEGYHLIDLQFNLPENVDNFIKNILIPKSIDFIVSTMKNTGLMDKIEVKEAS